MTTRPALRCEHMAQDPHQCSMYYSWKQTKFQKWEYCLPCIVAIYHETGDKALIGGVEIEMNKGAMPARLRVSA
jgi:hypothetical protein